jgi:hypothetical protein
LLLARTGRCSEALPISQALVASVPEDPSAVANAEEMILICEGESDTPLIDTPTPTLTPEAVKLTPAS